MQQNEKYFLKILLVISNFILYIFIIFLMIFRCKNFDPFRSAAPENVALLRKKLKRKRSGPKNMLQLLL